MKLDDLLKKDRERDYVAHYTNAETAIEFILKEKKIRFSSLKKSNDPQEFIDKIRRVVSKSEDPVEKMMEASELILNNVHTFCTSISTNSETDFISKTSFGKPKMWAHYGQKHKGICLLFGKEELKKKIVSSNPQKNWINEIRYGYKEEPKRDYTPYSIYIKNNVEEEVINHLDIYKDELLFKKNPDWSSEAEYRFAIYCREEYFNVEIESSLKAVILGYHFSDVYIDLIKEISGVDVFKLSWDTLTEDFSLRSK